MSVNSYLSNILIYFVLLSKRAKLLPASDFIYAPPEKSEDAMAYEYEHYINSHAKKEDFNFS